MQNSSALAIFLLCGGLQVYVACQVIAKRPFDGALDLILSLSLGTCGMLYLMAAIILTR